MKKSFVASIAVASIALSIALISISCNTKNNQKQASSYKLKPFKEVTLSNGLNVTLIKDTLPYFAIQAVVGSGSSSDPKSKRGLAHIVGKTLNKGSLKKSATQIAQELDFQGSSFDLSVTKDSTQISLSGLSLYREEALKNLSDIMTQPSFPKNEIHRAIEQSQSQLKTLTDKPTFAQVIFNRYIYNNHPYSHPTIGYQKDLKTIKRADVVSFYNEHYSAKNMWLSIIGDFNEDKIMSDLEKYFGTGRLISGKRNSPTNSKLIENKELRIILINKPDLKQANIIIGQLAARRSSPHHMPLKVINSALSSSGSSSLLVKEIREKRGLTYSIRSNFNALKDRGYFLISTATRPGKVYETISETLKIVNNLVENGATKERVESSKSFLKGRFSLSLETPEELSSNLLYLKFHSVGADFFSNYISTIQNISNKDFNKTLREILSPKKMTIVVYAPSNLVREQLEKIGPVEEIQYNSIKL